MKKGVVIILGLILASTLLLSIASLSLVSASAPSWSGSYCICNQGSPIYGCDDAGGASNCNQAKVFVCPLNKQNCDGVNGCDTVTGLTCPASGSFGFQGVSQSCGNARCDTTYETYSNCPSDCPAPVVTCNSFTYTYGSCSATCGGGTQTMTVATQSPSGCTGGTPQTSQACNTQACIPVCTELNWNSTLSPISCPASGNQVKNWSKIGTCSGGVSHPSSELVSCTYVAPATCNDSDGVLNRGWNYYVKGYVYSNVGPEAPESGWDGCLDDNYQSNAVVYANGTLKSGGTGTKVSETYCDVNKIFASKIVDCPNGCFDGACIIKENLSCVVDATSCNLEWKKPICGLTGNFSYNQPAKQLCNIPGLSGGSAGFDMIDPGCAKVSVCPNGCSNGACINATQSVESNASCFENYKLTFTSFVTDGGIDKITLKKSDGSWSKQVKAGDIVSLGNVELKINYIYNDYYDGQYFYEDAVNFSVVSPSIIDYFSGDHGRTGRIINSVQMHYIPEESDYFVVSYCGNKTTKTQACSSLINSIATPTSTDERHLSWNDNYAGSEWINNEQESYTQYSTSWYWNSEEYQENQLNYYYVTQSVQVFDNNNIDLSQYSFWNGASPACKLTSYNLDGKSNYYYICNWDAFNSNQDLTNNYESNNREILWYKDNVIVRLYIYWGQSLTDAQVSKLATLKINTLIEDLKNNNYKYADWNNFEIAYPASNELSNTLSACSSDLYVEGSKTLGTWSCKTEPVICPEHGYQTKTCQRVNYATSDSDIQTSQISCSPGICSGCYIPKWFGSNSGDSRCIPYGFRFAQQFGYFRDLVYEENPEAVTVSEFNRDVKGLMVLEAINESQVLIKVDTNKLKEEAPDFVYSVTVKPDSSSNGIDSYYVSVGKTGNITIQEFAGANAETMYLALKDISFDASNPNNTKVTLIVGYTSIRSKPLTMNAYCDIDGLIKEQKMPDTNGGWATCQNNYECRSNICSEGECIQAISMMKQAQEFIVKVLCKLSNPISDSEYKICYDKYSQ